MAYKRDHDARKSTPLAWMFLKIASIDMISRGERVTITWKCLNCQITCYLVRWLGIICTLKRRSSRRWTQIISFKFLETSNNNSQYQDRRIEMKMMDTQIDKEQIQRGSNVHKKHRCSAQRQSDSFYRGEWRRYGVPACIHADQTPSGDLGE